MAGSHLLGRLISRRQTQSSDGCCMQNHPAARHHKILPLPGLGFDGNESWAVAPAVAHTLPCASCERCQGGLGKQGSVKARLRLSSSTDLSRPKPRAKAPPVTRGQNNQPAALGDAQLGRSAASSRRGDVPGGRDDSCHPPLRLRGRPGATTGSKAQQRPKRAPNMAEAPAEGENLRAATRSAGAGGGKFDPHSA